ncbi:MAG: molybdopterin-dependent oxidoreductase [Candidatus Nanopelagicales bacterium]
MSAAADTPRVVERDPARLVLAGGTSALVGLATTELLALVLPGSPSPTAALADRIISWAPDGFRETLIGAVGTADKPLLVVGIVLGVVLAGALVGFLVRARRVPWAFAAGAVLAWLACWTGGVQDGIWLAVVLAAGVGAGALVWTRLVLATTRPTLRAAAPDELDRRAFLRLTAVLAAAGAAGVGVAAVVRRGSAAAVDAARSAIGLPTPTRPAAPLPAGADVPGIPPAVTPNADFYQIDTALVTPAVQTSDWSLSVSGRVSTPLTLTYDELLALPSVERYVTLTCVSNPVGGDLVGNAKWQGVLLADVLAQVGVRPDADALVGVSVDGFTAGFPLSVLSDGREALIAYAMNDEPLPVKHGFPARLVVPGLYGYVSATKWLTEIRLTTLQETVPFWLARGWAADGTIELASRIDVPRTGTVIVGGTVAVGGRAWHQHRGIEAVQVRVDGGPWEDATLASDVGDDAWRLWSWQWAATPGPHTLECRARSSDGTWQSEDVHDVFPGASSGLHRVEVEVGGTA